jgi:fructose-1,6-bisphosphatase/inositol monophosphatase family enzyme
MLWDIAGAAIVLREAGAALSAPDGTPLFPVTGAQMAGAPFAFVADNPASHRQALDDIGAASALAR